MLEIRSYSPSKHRGDLPSDLEAVVMHCLAKKAGRPLARRRGRLAAALAAVPVQATGTDGEGPAVVDRPGVSRDPGTRRQDGTRRFWSISPRAEIPRGRLTTGFDRPPANPEKPVEVLESSTLLSRDVTADCHPAHFSGRSRVVEKSVCSLLSARCRSLGCLVGMTMKPGVESQIPRGFSDLAWRACNRRRINKKRPPNESSTFRLALGLLPFRPVFAAPTGPARANYYELLRRIPESAKTIILIDVERMFMSPIAMKQKWRERGQLSRGNGGPLPTQRCARTCWRRSSPSSAISITCGTSR